MKCTDERPFIVKISGKYINPYNKEGLQRYVKTLFALWKEGCRLAIVVGGGEIARAYIEALKLVNSNNSHMDLLGIEAARLNARLLAYALYPHAYPEPPASIEEAVRLSLLGKMIIMGGLQPGQSTAMVAALLAEALRAKLLIIATTVNGIYTSDPRKDPSARLLKRITYKEAREVLHQSIKPGHYELLDFQALNILERSTIPVRVIHGGEPENITRAIHGEDVGTLITSG